MSGRLRALTNGVYDLVMGFPPDERFSLTQQLKRAAWSMTANIVEGFNRLSAKDKIRFYNVSL
ncbi:MAG TPA: four helix bundle protein, partial [Planctomycetota bacterium]|nr:four helix bundle protein [Planctomycetota bacterium]